jgi:hypothetical protein
MRGVLAQARAAHQRLNEQDYERALPELRALESRLAQLSLSSGWLKWALAVALDMSGDCLAALDKSKQALAEDPLNGAHRASWGIIIQHLKEKLTTAPDGDPTVPELYARLQFEDECDVPCHLAWVRHLVHGGHLEEAARLAEAVTLLAPVSVDVWQARARVARLQGKEAEAAEFEGEARLRAGQPVAFGIPEQGDKS